MSTFRIGSRGSALALSQTRRVHARLEKLFPQHTFETVVISTAGDQRQSTPITALDEGAFVTAIETALLEQQIDLAVHSLKDVPVQPGENAGRLMLAALPERADPRDVLISRTGRPLHELQSEPRIATGSPRRAAQIHALRPDARIEPIRGNVDTRLRKLQEQEMDALVIAAAGLDRLGLADRATQYFEPTEVTPAVGQGTLVVQCRAEDAICLEIAEAVDSKSIRQEALAEREVLAALGGGCRVPVGALARVQQSRLTLVAMMSTADGRGIRRITREGPAKRAVEIGREVAALLEAEPLARVDR